MLASLITTDRDETISEARIAVGACSPVAQRLPELEAELRGRHRNDLLEDLPIPDHLQALAPIDDVRASASYRLDATLALIRRSLRRFAEVA
jgi:CO/xanthine dehydrogenase FAD-binding subunit